MPLAAREQESLVDEVAQQGLLLLESLLLGPLVLLGLLIEVLLGFLVVGGADDLVVDASDDVFNDAAWVGRLLLGWLRALAKDCCGGNDCEAGVATAEKNAKRDGANRRVMCN